MGLLDSLRRGKGPDFSVVDSPDKASLLEGEGVLERMYLMPLAFGGSERQDNWVWVPRGIAALKDETDAMVADLARQGEITGYSADLEYRKSSPSIIPRKVVIRGRKNGVERFTQTINIW